jgi:prepilin-type N-terminal cleavage/methylation domain-containing protein
MTIRLGKQYGFTLVELLVSITILMIVLISFFTIFSNTASFTQKNSEDLQAMNLAKDILEKVKEPKPIAGNNSETAPYVIQLMNGKGIDKELTLSSKGYLSLTHKDKIIADKLMKELGLKKDWRFDTTLTSYSNDKYINNLQLKLTLTPTTVSSDYKKPYELVMVTVSIYEEQAVIPSDSPLSETYGYVRVGGK